MRLAVLREACAFIIARTDSTCSGVNPNLRPISSGVGTGLAITYTAMYSL